MNNNIKKELGEVIILIFTMTLILAVGMIFVYNILEDKSRTNAMQSLALVQMLIPAMATIVVKNKIHKENNEEIPKNIRSFYRLYSINFVISIIVVFLGIFLNPIIPNIILSFVSIGFSIALLFIVGKNEDNAFDSINMKLGKNLKKVVIVCLTFIGLELIMLIPDLIKGSPEEINAIVRAILLLPIYGAENFFAFIIFFGEEFGWRGFIQPRLQKLYGKKLGVIILGGIWGIWHMPLCFMLYSPSSPIQSIVLYIAFCTLLGIFVGYAYMKTENIWAPILIHLINNCIAIGANQTLETTLTWSQVIKSIAILLIVNLPFLLTKEYKEESSSII